MFENYSLWDRLRDVGKPIFLYGTGNGGDKIIAALEKYGVTLTGVFASDGFVRDRYFHSMKVRSYSDITSEYGNDIIILLAFGTTLPDVISFIKKLDELHELYIPDVPLYGGELFDYTYFISHKNIITATSDLLADEESHLVFEDAINFRLTGKLKYLRRTENVRDTLRGLFSAQKFRTVIDGGAYTGDSTSEMIEALTPERVIAVEADPKTYSKLKKHAEHETRSSVVPLNVILWGDDGSSRFVSSGSRGSGVDGNNKRAAMMLSETSAIDKISDGYFVDFIKLDVEGAEERALAGATKTLSACQTNLSVSLYHRTEDIFSLVSLVRKLLPEHRLYVRRRDCIPLWDINLYAVRK